MAISAAVYLTINAAWYAVLLKGSGELPIFRSTEINPKTNVFYVTSNGELAEDSFYSSEDLKQSFIYYCSEYMEIAPGQFQRIVTRYNLKDYNLEEVIEAIKNNNIEGIKQLIEESKNSKTYVVPVETVSEDNKPYITGTLYQKDKDDYILVDMGLGKTIVINGAIVVMPFIISTLVNHAIQGRSIQEKTEKQKQIKLYKKLIKNRKKQGEI